MDDMELLKAISQMMDDKLHPINTRLDSIEVRLDKIQEDVEILKEDSSVTREATNNLLDWAEKAQVQVQIPLFNKAE